MRRARLLGITVTICSLSLGGCVGPLAFDGTSESIGGTAYSRRNARVNASCEE